MDHIEFSAPGIANIIYGIKNSSAARLNSIYPKCLKKTSAIKSFFVAIFHSPL